MSVKGNAHLSYNWNCELDIIECFTGINENIKLANQA